MKGDNAYEFNKWVIHQVHTFTITLVQFNVNNYLACFGIFSIFFKKIAFMVLFDTDLLIKQGYLRLFNVYLHIN